MYLMAKKLIKIPYIVEELRIGFSFNYLIKVIAETEAAESVQTQQRTALKPKIADTEYPLQRECLLKA